MKNIIFTLLLSILLTQGSVQAQQIEANNFEKEADTFAGIYRFNDQLNMIIMPHPDQQILSIYDMQTGDVRPLKETKKNTFVYGPNILSTSPVEGSISFKVDTQEAIENVVWYRNQTDSLTGYPVPFEKQDVEFKNADKSTISGWLFMPPGSGSFPVAVVAGPGMTGRYKLWRVAMSLIAEEIGVLVYDKRGVGKSTGDQLSSHYYTRSLQHAEDLKAAIRFVMKHQKSDSNKIGVVGWSQTGWISAIAASEFNNLAFYVNIAGNANPGWQQNMWNKISDLRFEGFSEKEIEEARNFLDIHFDLMHKATSWEEYQQAVREDSSKSWFKYLENKFRYLWKSEEEAYQYAVKEQDNIPANDFRKVKAPTLGIYFEYDESNPPDSPTIFLESRLEGKNDDVTLHVFPNTSHSGFIMPWYPVKSRQSKVTKIEPWIFQALQSWVSKQIESNK